MLVDQTSLSILFKQCRKLVGLAESTEIWRAGPYGHFLTTCDAATLVELRRIWTTYLDTANWSSKQAEHFKRRFIDAMKENSRKMGSSSATAASHSAGPPAIHADEALSSQFNSYWSSGITDDSAQGQKERLTVNPTFAFSIDGDRFAVHHGTDPLSGFHLAEVFASGKFIRPRENIPPHEVVCVAKDQFSRWCTSVSKCLKGSNPLSPTFVIRMFAGDALMFCQALKFCEVTRSPATPYNIAAWRLSSITLDDHYYGRYALSPAPLWFNVIDTSNILDHVGLVNVLVVTVPLLRKMQSATLYTETLLSVGDNPSQAVLEHICGDVPTMALLLGVIPSTFISQFTTRSNAHETLMMMMGKGATPYHERLAWKAIGLGGTTSWAHFDNTPTPPQRLSFPPEELAAFLFGVYLNMFSDKDVTSRFQLLTLSPRTPKELQRAAVPHYTPRSFALLVRLIKTRVHTDWTRAMDLLEEFALTDGSLLLGFRELSCHLHLLGIYTAPWMSIPAVSHLEQMPVLGLFHNWSRTHIPQVVTLVFIVPRDAISGLEPDSMDDSTPALQCEVHSGPVQTQSTVISATFGALHVSGIGEHRTCVVIEDTAHPPWKSKAPLIVTFSVPSTTVMACAPNPAASVGLVLRETPGVNSAIFRTPLGDTEHVYVLARHPVVRTKHKPRHRSRYGHGHQWPMAGKRLGSKHWRLGYALYHTPGRAHSNEQYALCCPVLHHADRS
ncbi:hypothetical protein J3R83DRAFT_2742 [Lanmaoa asiatica]|nr:hypothetical protein J3R83DRAFT_2742 [Lanmaoa asiatica]